MKKLEEQFMLLTECYYSYIKISSILDNEDVKIPINVPECCYSKFE